MIIEIFFQGNLWILHILLQAKNNYEIYKSVSYYICTIRICVSVYMYFNSINDFFSISAWQFYLKKQGIQSQDL